MDALQEFLAEVYRTDGYGEVQRLYQVFYKVHTGREAYQEDWSDKTGDGNLKVKPGVRARLAGGKA